MRVGTSTSLHSFIRAIKDHPHACGDKRLIILNGAMARGSSPCVWGQATIFLVTFCGIGIIPMRVGTSHDRR